MLTCEKIFSHSLYIQTQEYGMDTYNIMNARPSIDNSAVASVKDMILNRAKEKAASMTKEQNEATTSSVQNDVMAQARASITDSKPRFGMLSSAKNSVAETQKQSVQETTNNTSEDTTPQLKRNIQSVDSSTYNNSMRDETMTALKNQYSGRRMNLSQSLQFLNTQAAIQTLSKTHSKIV